MHQECPWRPVPRGPLTVNIILAFPNNFPALIQCWTRSSPMTLLTLPRKPTARSLWPWLGHVP
eukprot:2689676-Prorocentrum_lima.AAC.1